MDRFGNTRDIVGVPSWRWVVMWAVLVGIILAGMFGILPRPTKDIFLVCAVGLAAAVYLLSCTHALLPHKHNTICKISRETADHFLAYVTKGEMKAMRRARGRGAASKGLTGSQGVPSSTMLSIDLARQSLGQCLGQGKEGRVFAVSHPQARSLHTLKELVNTNTANHELEVHQELSNNPEMHPYVTRLYTHKCTPTGDLDPCNTTKRKQPKQGVCYGLMERATMDLKDFLTSENSPFVQGALPGSHFDSLCTLLGQVLMGLHVAQTEHQFTHNDLHWENVLVHKHGDDDDAQLDDMYRCKLYDFGYARTEQLQRQKLSKSQAYMRNFNSGYDLCELFAYVLHGVREKSVPLAKAERAQFETLCENIAPEIIKAASRNNLRPKPSNTTAVSPRTALGEMSRRVELPRRLLEANKPTNPNKADPNTKRNAKLRRSRRLRSRTRPWTRARARAAARSMR